jgi:hypothetical protein
MSEFHAHDQPMTMKLTHEPGGPPTPVGIDVEARYTVFGSSGAIAFSLLSDLLLEGLLPDRRPAPVS